MTKQQLAADLALKMHQVGLLRQKLEQNLKKLAEVHKQREQLEKELLSEEHSIYKLRETLLVLEGVLFSTVSLRQEIFTKQERASLKTITVGEKEQLGNEISVLQKRLQKECLHQFVLSYDGYRGSAFNDLGDAHYGAHLCVVCGLKETEASPGSDKYKIMPHADCRMIKRDLRHLAVNKINLIGQPLEQYLEVFYQSAGCMNAVWPKEEKAK